MNARAWFRWSIALVTVIALTATACGGSKHSSSQSTSTSSAPSVQIHGDANDPVNKIVISAIGDLQQYWTDEFPKLYGKPYTPVNGGFYAVTSSTPLPPCAQAPDDIAGNAFYCAKADDVAWDAQGLLPDLRKRFGDFVIPVVLAHEWGHAVQARANFEGQTVTKEIQADCFAGAWAAHAAKGGAFKPTDADIDRALAGFLSLRDEPGTEKHDPKAHGSGFDRVNSFQTGLENGPDACKAYKDGDPQVVEIPFTDVGDMAEGGNAPYDDIVAGVPGDLEDYWSQVYPKLANNPWTPLQPPRPFDPAQQPTCGGAPTTGYLLFYCVPEDYVGFDTVNAMPEIYSEGGDFAVATLIATQYGLAVLTRLGQDPTDKTTSLRGDCMAGAWTASLYLQDRPTSNYHLSPGDLDKAVAALLLFRGSGDVARQGQGYQRIDAYRDGVLNGAKACVSA